MDEATTLYTIHIKQLPHVGGYLVRCPQLPELNSKHVTVRQAVEAAAMALQELSRGALGRAASRTTAPAED